MINPSSSCHEFVGETPPKKYPDNKNSSQGKKVSPKKSLVEKKCERWSEAKAEAGAEAEAEIGEFTSR